MADDVDTSDDLLPAEFPELTNKEMTPPHGDELRSEVTFGRTDRYSNVDEEEATRELPVEDPEASRDTRQKR